jgi:acyl-CoA dehydrogenase
MVDFSLSPKLDGYGAELRRWGVEKVRPHARQADTDHAVPATATEILDTAPVPLVDRPGDVMPDFDEGLKVQRLVWAESVMYSDCWLYESMNQGLGHFVVQAIGTPEQVERWYDPIVRQGGRTGFGLSESGAGSDTGGLATTATRDGDAWVINGSKMYCSLGAISEYIVVFATVDKSQGRSAIKAFVVEKDTPGLVVLKANEDKLGLRCWTTSQLAFDQCAIPVGNILGGVDEKSGAPLATGYANALSELNLSRPNVSAFAVGLGRAATELTTELLFERRAGFTPQRWGLINAELEQMRAALDRARWLNLRAQSLVDRGASNRLEATIAKAYAPPVAEKIIRRCMQLIGPDGSSTELLLEKWYRDVKILDIFEGTGQIMRLLISRSLMGREAAA